MFIKVEKLNNDEYNVSKFKDEEILPTEMDDNIEQTIDASTYSEPVEILPTKDGMKKATITLSNIPTAYDLEANKSETIDVSTYSEPIEITPTSGKDAMQKTTITLSGIKQEQSKEVNIAENGTTIVEPDEGKTLSSITINADVKKTWYRWDRNVSVYVPFSDTSGFTVGDITTIKEMYIMSSPTSMIEYRELEVEITSITSLNIFTYVRVGYTSTVTMTRSETTSYDRTF